MPLLQIQNLKAEYPLPDGSRFTVLQIPAFELNPGECIAMRGRSGSGKTTFLNIISGILGSYSGSVKLKNQELKALSEAQRDVFRGKHIGFIFQTFHLLPGFTAIENVILGSVFAGDQNEETKVTRKRARDLLKQVGLEHREKHFPKTLSSGEQQRVAIARALMNQPELILADEPTGSLDEGNGREVLQLIKKMAEASGTALLLVTHDPTVMEGFHRVVDLKELSKP